MASFKEIRELHLFSVENNTINEEEFFLLSKGFKSIGGGHDLAKFRVPMIHRFMTSHPVAKLLLCFGAKHQDGRPMLFGFFVILSNRLTELCTSVVDVFRLLRPMI